MKYNTVEPREVSEAREVNIFNTTKRTHTQKKRILYITFVIQISFRRAKYFLVQFIFKRF